MTKKKQSEFGKGFIYNLILFAKHWWKCQELLGSYRRLRVKNPKLFSDKDALAMWWNGASDHFMEFEIPKQWQKKKIGKLAEQLSNKAWHWGHEFEGQDKLAEKDFGDFFEQLEELARLIDKELGVSDIEATWH